MARYRLSARAKDDIESVLAESQERWGIAARERYEVLLSASFRRIVADPTGLSVVARSDLPGELKELKSFALRHARRASRGQPVAHPVHVVFFRIIAADMVEIVRVLHERMDPTRHLDEQP